MALRNGNLDFSLHTYTIILKTRMERNPSVPRKVPDAVGFGGEEK